MTELPGLEGVKGAEVEAGKKDWNGSAPGAHCAWLNVPCAGSVLSMNVESSKRYGPGAVGSCANRSDTFPGLVSSKVWICAIPEGVEEIELGGRGPEVLRKGKRVEEGGGWKEQECMSRAPSADCPMPQTRDSGHLCIWDSELWASRVKRGLSLTPALEPCSASRCLTVAAMWAGQASVPLWLPCMPCMA